MIRNPFKRVPHGCLGIDIGTSSIRVVELSAWRGGEKLENYGELAVEVFLGNQFKTLRKNECVLSNKNIAQAISAILNEAKIKTKRTVFSIPDFSSFFTWFELPPMTEEEVPEAVKNEARQYIPFPLSEVVLDWQIINGSSFKKEQKLKILLVSVPREVINQYKQIASLLGLEVVALEAEVFGLTRAVIRKEKPGFQSTRGGEVVVIMDIGSQSTTVSVIDKGILKRSHSFDIAGNELTSMLSRAFHIDLRQAEEMKHRYGLVSQSEPGAEVNNARQILLPLIDLILTEVDKVCQSFVQVENKKIDGLIIAGGGALIPGLREYFSQWLKRPVEVANPFAGIFYPPVLEDLLREMGPSYSVAMGAAMRGVE